MTCIAEVITPELWEIIKNEIGGNFKMTIETRERPFGSNIIGTNRIIHVETGNYMCRSVPMMFGRSGRWFFYMMDGFATCFCVYGPGDPMLMFNSKGEPFSSKYFEFKEQVTEIFSTMGIRLSMKEGGVFVPHFPDLKNEK